MRNIASSKWVGALGMEDKTHSPIIFVISNSFLPTVMHYRDAMPLVDENELICG